MIKEKDIEIQKFVQSENNLLHESQSNQQQLAEIMNLFEKYKVETDQELQQKEQLMNSMLEEQKAELSGEMEQVLSQLENALKEVDRNRDSVLLLERAREEKTDDYRRLTDSFYRLKKEKEDDE